MTISLLEFQGGGVSLEFDKADIDKLKQVIFEHFGEIQNLNKGPAFTVVEFGGERFTYYYEWDPCLISQNENGAAMLRKIGGLPFDAWV